MNEAQRLATAATARFGIPFAGTGQFRQGSQIILLRPVELSPPHGFSVEIKSGWRSLDALLVLDSYAADLLASMADADLQRKTTFAAVASLMVERGIRLDIRVNDLAFTAATDLPPAPWRRFDMAASCLSDAAAQGQESVMKELTELTLIFLNLVFALLPVDEASGKDAQVFAEGLPEGAKTRIEVNRYERNPINRAACIAAHGHRCKACGMDLGEFYGTIGAGYIEVHHVVPVSGMGDAYVVDPIHDLVPLCPNCHAIVHRQSPPLDVSDLARRLEDLRSRATEQDPKLEP
jgi:5-methylcytosine-specific restriction protein A